MNFLHFSTRISPIGIISSLFPLRYCLSSDRCHHAVTLGHASFSLSQDELAASALFSSNALSYRLPSRAETETLNPHHHHRLLSSDRLTLILHCYKKIISTLVILPTTQSCLYFTFSLVRVPCHRSSIHHCHSISLPSHVHYPSAQRHSVMN
jgi:hypothetical protein